MSMNKVDVMKITKSDLANEQSKDNASNFVNKLTHEFKARLGCSPRFNTPAHPEASGVCKRWNTSLKNAIHHIITERMAYGDSIQSMGLSRSPK